MTPTIRFDDARDLADLATFIGRAARVEEGAVRLQAAGDALAVWVPVLRPQTILDTSPVVIGLRVVRASIDGADPSDAQDGSVDVTVPVRAVLDRLARVDADASTISLPPDRIREAWAAVSPPRGGWRRVAQLESTTLNRVAEAGIDDVAKAVPGELGTALVERVRTETWTRPLPETGLDDDDAPVAGVAFAAHALGFLVEPESVGLSMSAGWLRLSLRRGHVLSRARRVERLAHPLHD